MAPAGQWILFRPLYANADSLMLVTSAMPVTEVIPQHQAKAAGGMVVTPVGTKKVPVVVHGQFVW